MTDVAIVGGGVIGLSIAWRLATAGVTVTVYDEAPMQGASWAAAGMLAPTAEANYGEESLLQLNIASSRLYPAFVAELQATTGTTVGYEVQGTLMVGITRDDIVYIDEHRRFANSLNLDTQSVSSRECRSWEPALAPSITGGVYFPDDHQVDNRLLLHALRTACAMTGVKFVAENVQALEVKAGRSRGVVLANGEIHSAAHVVIASGASAQSIEGAEHFVPPTRPVYGEIIRLMAPQRLAQRVVRAMVRGSEVYVVCRRDGGIVVGATVNERALGESATAAGVHRLLDDAREVLPDIDDTTFVEAIARRRPATLDGAPVLGRSDLPGLILAAGHYRNGMLLAPITADIISEVITTGATPDIAKPFSAQRFALVGARE